MAFLVTLWILYSIITNAHDIFEKIDDYLQSVRLEIPANVVIGTLGVSPFIAILCRPSLHTDFKSCCLSLK